MATELIQPKTFAPGQIVRLKSGGPAMTIEGIHSATRWTCVWFNPDCSIGRAIFAEMQLVTATPDNWSRD